MRGVWKVVALCTLVTATFSLRDEAATWQLHAGRLHFRPVFKESQVKSYPLLTKLLPAAGQRGWCQSPQHIEGAYFSYGVAIEEPIGGMDGEIKRKLADRGHAQIIDQNAGSIAKRGFFCRHDAYHGGRDACVLCRHLHQMLDSCGHDWFGVADTIKPCGIGNVERWSLANIFEGYFHCGSYALVILDDLGQWRDVPSQPWPLLQDHGLLSNFKILPIEFVGGIGRPHSAESDLIGSSSRHHLLRGYSLSTAALPFCDSFAALPLILASLPKSFCRPPQANGGHGEYYRESPDDKLFVVLENVVRAENKKIFVVPGRFAAIEMTNPATGVVTTAEVPLGPFGWEYEAL